MQSAAEQADIVVAFLHAGAEGADKTHVPRGPERAFGEVPRRHAATSRGRRSTPAPTSCSGSGPHVLRGLELYKGRLIAYSLGNLAGYKNFGTGGPQRPERADDDRGHARRALLRGRIDVAARSTAPAIPARRPGARREPA